MMNSNQFPKAKKSLSQVFLKVTWPGQWLVGELREQGVKRVLEIGPGPGILTKALLDAGIEVTAVEKDVDLAAALPGAVFDAAHPERLNDLLRIVTQDILRFDLAAWCQQSGESIAVVGNIPYQISSPILAWLLPHMPRLKVALFLVQAEFGHRLASAHGSRQYGSLSVFAALRSRVTLGPEVPRRDFHPMPKVDSALVKLIPIPCVYSETELRQCERLTKHMFSMRRKKVSNSLKAYFSDLNLVADLLDLNERAENIPAPVFAELARRSLHESSKSSSGS